MSHRVTIKELQERLDEMKAQRDETRDQCSKLTNELNGAKRTIESFRMDNHEVMECHDFLDAFDERNGGHRQVVYSLASVANNRVRLSNRVAKVLLDAAILEGKLYQADAIRTWCPDPRQPPDNY